MYDCHYDLLTYIYINRNNLKKVKNYCKKIFKNNITGGIFNLFYMSQEEMKIELGIKKEEINLFKNLEVVDCLIKQNNLIPTNVKYIYGIEGLDYLQSIEDIDMIYNLGVRSVNIVWNNDNKFGGGAKGDKNRGLTDDGKNLVKKLVDKKIAIDLSHANNRTFYDIVRLCENLKKQNNKPIILASHSNVKKICDVERNLDDNQILKIRELNGIIGIVGVKRFCSSSTRKIFNKKDYIKHMEYIKTLLGDTENIAVATDDMTYYKTFYYKHFNVFRQNRVKNDLEYLLLKNNFSKEEIKQILYTNFESKILQRL